MHTHDDTRQLYGVEARPRVSHTITVSLQHALLALLFLVYPLAAAQQIGLSQGDSEKFLTAVILSMGGATFLHGFRRPFGSGALAVEIPTPAYLSTVAVAGSAGGLPMLAGISLVSGVVELFFAGLLRRLRALFPAEVCGVAVLMLGISLVRPAVLNILASGTEHPAGNAGPLAVAAITLATITALAIFATGRLKLLALGGGILAGIGLSGLLGLTGIDYWNSVGTAAWIGLPTVDLGAARFSLELLPLCVVMALILSIDNVGMLIGLQRQMDPSWSRIDMGQASSGIRVSAVGDVLAGILGGMPTGISSANISLSHATGAIARRLSHVTGILLLATAFSPKAIKALTLVPEPVVGAVMIYAAAYMLVSGVNLFLGRLLNERRMFVVGFSIVFGLSPVVVPDLFSQAPPLMRLILESPLALGSFCAILLTQLFRIGSAAKIDVAIALPHSDNEMVHELVCNKALRAELVRLGAKAGAARPLVYRAIDVTAEWIGWLKVNGFINGDVQLSAAFVENRLNITLTYDGRQAPAMLTDAQPGRTGGNAFHQLRAQVDHFSAGGNGPHQQLALGFEASN